MEKWEVGGVLEALDGRGETEHIGFNGHLWKMLWVLLAQTIKE